ncbi:hypothetical protein ACPA9J_06325 [Pseudomonas aeruginosa]
MTTNGQGQQEYSVSLQILLDHDRAELHPGVRHADDQLHPDHHRLPSCARRWACNRRRRTRCWWGWRCS